MLSFSSIFILDYLKIVLLHGREKFSLLPGCIYDIGKPGDFTRHVSIARRASIFVFAARHQLIYRDTAVI